MRYSYYSSRPGFLAITTAIILSLVLLTVALSVGSLGVLTRTRQSDTVTKSLTFTLARSCVDYALLKLVQNSNYLGNELRTIDGKQCTILGVENSGQNKIIKTWATIQNLTTKVRATVQISPFQLITLEEVSSF